MHSAPQKINSGAKLKNSAFFSHKKSHIAENFLVDSFWYASNNSNIHRCVEPTVSVIQTSKVRLKNFRIKGIHWLIMKNYESIMFFSIHYAESKYVFFLLKTEWKLLNKINKFFQKIFFLPKMFIFLLKNYFWKFFENLTWKKSFLKILVRKNFSEKKI